jgi:hypothetical protein
MPACVALALSLLRGTISSNQAGRDTVKRNTTLQILWWLRNAACSPRACIAGKEEGQSSRTQPTLWAFAILAIGFVSPLLGQQKGQWVPRQFGLNAGVIPDPGITYANLALNYSSSFPTHR